MDRPVEERVSLVEQAVSGHGSELHRTRERLHEIETDRATIRLLATQVSELKASIERVATRAATEAVTQVLAARDESERGNTGLQLDRWALWTVVVGTGASIYFNTR